MSTSLGRNAPSVRRPIQRKRRRELVRVHAVEHDAAAQMPDVVWLPPLLLEVGSDQVCAAHNVFAREGGPFHDQLTGRHLSKERVGAGLHVERGPSIQHLLREVVGKEKPSLLRRMRHREHHGPRGFADFGHPRHYVRPACRLEPGIVDRVDEIVVRGKIIEHGPVSEIPA
jgi:hypothetical protein